MWIPVILVILAGIPEWHIFPPPSRPYKTEAECYEAIEKARHNIMQYPKYQKGMSLCIEIKYPEIT